MVQAAKANDDLRTGFTKELMDLARAKLVRLSNAYSHHTNYTLNAKLAVIDVRVQLDYDLKCEAATDTVARLVESHMRTAFSIPQYRKYMRSGYPSEAWLAEAAAQEMVYLHKQRPTFVFDTLDEVLESGIIEPGERGEVIARVIITHAYDSAVQKTSPTLDGDPVRFSHGCLLTEFIESLFSGEAAKEVLDSQAHDAGCYDGNKLILRDRFKKARVRFTHFERLDDQTNLSVMGCVLGMTRCAAFIARRGEKAIDMVIPIILDPERLESDLLKTDNMTAMLIQVKNRCDPGSAAANVINVDKGVPFFSGGSQPYISLVMELGAIPRQLVEQESEMGKGDMSSPKKTKTLDNPSELTTEQPGSSHYKATRHSCYSIFAYGCSPIVYHMSSLEAKRYGTLLHKGGFYTEHPRTDEGSLRALHRFMPLASLSAGFEWLTKGDNKIDDGSIDLTEELMHETVVLGL